MPFDTFRKHGVAFEAPSSIRELSYLVSPVRQWAVSLKPFWNQHPLKNVDFSCDGPGPPRVTLEEVRATQGHFGPYPGHSGPHGL